MVIEIDREKKRSDITLIHSSLNDFQGPALLMHEQGYMKPEQKKKVKL